MPRATYKAMKLYLEDALHDLSILAGERVGPSDASWQDVAGTCSVNLDCLSNQLKEARQGNHESFIVFPGPVRSCRTALSAHGASVHRTIERPNER
jgi:hypothetical protein